MEKDDKKEILEAINGLETRVEKGINEAINGLETRVDSKFADVLEVIGDFSTKVDERFNKIESRIDKIDGRIDKMDGRLTRVESQMVTKEYLDDKLINLKADLTVLVHKEDDKLGTLTKRLASKKVITDNDAKDISAMEPFPQRA